MVWQVNDMKKLLLGIIAAVLFSAEPALAQYQSVWGWVSRGGEVVRVGGQPPTPLKYIQSFPGATVTVCVYGTSCASKPTIYTTPSGTIKTNPFTSDGNTGLYEFYGAPGTIIDLRFSGTGIQTPFTISGITIPGGGGGGGCPGAVPDTSVIFAHPLGTCDGVTKFTSNESGQVNISLGGTEQIESVTDPTNNYTFGQGHQWFIHSNSADYDGSTTDGFTAYVNDASTPPQTSGALTGTNVTVAGGLLTVTASGASTLFNQPSLYAYFTGFTNATFLNGMKVQVANADTTSLRAVGTGFSDYSSTADTGTVELQPSSNPNPFYSAMGCSLGGDCVGFNSDSQFFGENPQAHRTTDFLAGAYGDGPEFGYGFRAQEHLFVQVESAQVIAESNGTFNNEHQYAMKVGNPNATPFWWVDQIGDSFSREGFTNIASSSVGSCSLSTGLSDCTPSLATYLGPPASEIINIEICATGGTYDTFDWAEDNNNPTCASQHMLPTISGIPIADDVSITWGSQTGHTVGATAAIAVTVNFGTQLAVTGGTYLSSQALPQPGAPAVTPSPTGATSWEYAVSQSWNGVTTQVSSNTTITNGPATLDGSDFNNVAVTSSNGNPVIECTVYRTFAGGTPSTLGIIAGPSATICGTTLSDTGLAGDSSTPPSTNLTGHTTLGDGYLVFPAGVSWTVPQMTGSGPLCVSGGVISFTNHSCGGSGGGPGSPDLSIQGASGGDFVGIPGASFNATTGAISLTPTGGQNALAVNGNATSNTKILVTATNGGVGISTDMEDTNGSNTDGIVGVNAQVYESDNIGSGARIIAVSGFAELQQSNSGQDITSDTAIGGSFVAFGSADGNPAELTDILSSGNGGKATFTPTLVTGLRITDKNANNSPATTNAAILIENQTAGANVFSIKTGTGPVSFGDTVSGSSTINAATGFKVGGAATSTHYLRGNGTNYVDSAIQAGDLPATVVLTNQANTYSSGDKQIFGASTTGAASFNIPSGTAPTSPASGDTWNASGVFKFYDGSNTNSIVRIQGSVGNGNCPQFSGATGVLGDSGAPCSGSGGSSLFTSWQFASQTAITGTGQYFQLVPGTGLTSSYSGAGTSGSPFIGTLILANPSATTLGGIESFVAQTHKWINTISTSGVPSATQPGSTDLSDYGSVSPSGLFGGTNDAITIAGTAVALGGSTSSFPNPGIIGGGTPAAAHFTTISASGQFTSTQATGSAPFVVASTTVVANLNVSQLLGNTWTIPGAIGSTTPNSVAASTLSASSTVSGTGFQLYLASPPAIGGSAPAGGTFTTLVVNTSLGGAGVTSLFASPPAIGGSAPAAGTFTTLLATGILDGRAPITITTGSSASLGVTYNSGYTFNQNATSAASIVYTLPVAAAGRQYCFGNSDSSGTADTGTVQVVTSGAGQFIHANGTRSGSGGYIISAGAAGDKACVVGTTSTDWEFYPQVGTWTLH